jgi:hypothetical protein
MVSRDRHIYDTENYGHLDTRVAVSLGSKFDHILTTSPSPLESHGAISETKFSAVEKS